MNSTTKSLMNSKKKTRKAGLSMLATSPTEGAGWCSYPFSPQQLEARLRKKEKRENIRQLMKSV